MNGLHLLDATICSGIWEGLSYRSGCESDETRWAETSLVFSEVRRGGGSSSTTTTSSRGSGSGGGGGSSSISSSSSGGGGSGGGARGTDPATWWTREESGGSVFRFVGKGISHWRGRQIPFTLRGLVEQAAGNSTNGSLKITLIKRHVGSFSNVVLYEGLEVELEKQHVESYHNRIAYFGRVLAGGSSGGPGSQVVAGAMDDTNSVRLVGVYEHGDFILRRNQVVDYETGNMGGLSAGGHSWEAPTVLQACMELFRRCVEPGSAWSMAGGSRRTALVPPTARSYSGGTPPPPPLPPPPSTMPSVRPSTPLQSSAPSHVFQPKIYAQAQGQPGVPLTKLAPQGAQYQRDHRESPSPALPKAAATAGSRRGQEAAKDSWDWWVPHPAENGEKIASVFGAGVLDVADVASANNVGRSMSAWTNPSLGLGFAAGGISVDRVDGWSEDAVPSAGENMARGTRGSRGSAGGGPGGSPALVPGTSGGGRSNADTLPLGATLDKAKVSGGMLEWAGAFEGVGNGNKKLEFSTGEASKGGGGTGAGAGAGAARAGGVGMRGMRGIYPVGRAVSWTAAAAENGGRAGGEVSLRGGKVGRAELVRLGLRQGCRSVSEDGVLNDDSDGVVGVGSAGDNRERILSPEAGFDIGLDFGHGHGHGHGHGYVGNGGGLAGGYAEGPWDIDLSRARLSALVSEEGLSADCLANSSRLAPLSAATMSFEEPPRGLSSVMLADGSACSTTCGSNDEPSLRVTKKATVPESGLELYRKTLAGLVLGEGVAGVPGRENGGGSIDLDSLEGEQGSVSGREALGDLRVLRPCLADPSFVDDRHLEIIRSLAKNKAAALGNGDEVGSGNGGNAGNGHGNSRRGTVGDLGGDCSYAPGVSVIGTSKAGSGVSRAGPQNGDGCKICFSEPVDALLIPCGHLCVCVTCALRLRLCPVCRAGVHRVQSASTYRA